MTSLTVTVAAAAVLLYAAFCRLRRTDLDTHRSVRLSIVGQAGAASWVLLAAAIEPAFADPGWPAALLIAAFAATQIAGGRAWHDGVPDHYRRTGT